MDALGENVAVITSWRVRLSTEGKLMWLPHSEGTVTTPATLNTVHPITTNLCLEFEEEVRV